MIDFAVESLFCINLTQHRLEFHNFGLQAQVQLSVTVKHPSLDDTYRDRLERCFCVHRWFAVRIGPLFLEGTNG